MNLTSEQWKKLAWQRGERNIYLGNNIKKLIDAIDRYINAAGYNAHTFILTTVRADVVNSQCKDLMHPKTECCGYTCPTSSAYPIYWNPDNLVVQCHNCGCIYDARNSKPVTT